MDNRLTSVNAASELSVIAVMGVTGSGKSSFLSLVTGQEIETSDSLESCTQKTEMYKCFIDGQQFVFFDTPGFDDTYRGDADILADIGQALSVSYKNKMKLTGIIYLHRIKDERMTNAIMRNLTMFRSLCGDDAFKQVVLVTTFWDELRDNTVGAKRERELMTKTDWWGYMFDKGSSIRRFHNTPASALSIVRELTGLPSVTLQIQDEMVEKQLGIDKTTAGQTLDKELADLQAQFEREIENLRAEKERAKNEHDAQMQEFFENMEREKRELVIAIEKEQEMLHADRREEQRRMEQFFNDERLRLERERKARDLKIEELEARLSRERADSERRLQNALAESERAVTTLKTQMEAAHGQEREHFREQIVAAEKNRLEGERWRDEVIRLNAALREASIAQVTANTAEKAELQAKIDDLESQKKSGWDKFWSILKPIIGAGTIAASFLISGVPAFIS